MSDKETWLNPGQSNMWIWTFNHEGKLESTRIRPGQNVVITTEERRVNQDKAAEGKDIFTNGNLTPLRLVETAEDYAEIASNPNLLSEDDMKALFKLKVADFRSRVAEISNVKALSRLIEMAEEPEAAGVSVNMSQFKALKSRVDEINGPEVVEVVQSPTNTPSFRADPAINF